MRLVLGVLVAGLTLAAGVAAARAIELPPPPTLPTPTVPTVTLPVPVPPVTTPTVPKPPPPPPTPTIPKPPPPPTPPPVPSVTNQTQTTASSLTQTATNAARTATGASSSGLAAGGASGGSSGSIYSGSAAASGPGGSGSASGPPSAMPVNHFQSSRGWIGTTGPKKRRTTTFTFVLPHAGRVIFTVNQVSPQCLGVGHFSVRGRSGLNRVRFSGRVHGQQLGPGTYRISIRTPSGHVVRRVTLVVVGGSAPSREELRAMRAANTCPVRTEQASLISSGSASAASAASGSGRPPASSGASGSGLGVATPTGPNVHSGVLGSSIQETARALQPLLIVLLALSIILLAVASLPRYAVADPRMHDLLARHRVEIAGLGAAALVAVAVAFFVG